MGVGCWTNTSRHCDAIVHAMIDLGRHLDIVTVAEGVETEAQAQHLRERGCIMAQGYLFSRPVPTDVLQEWFARNDAATREAA